METLRPELFRQLERVFGAGKVKVSKQGQAIQWSLRQDDNGRKAWFFNEMKGDDWGEHFRVCCPLCADHKFRLSINHRWGLRDALTNSLHLWLIKCHHHDCFAYGDQQKIFHDELWNWGGAPADDPLRPGSAEPRKPGELDWPGTVWPLDRLPEDHACRLYLAGRGFNPDWLAEQFRVGFLLEAKWRLRHLQGRLVIPIFMEGKLIGWQARLTYDPPKHEKWHPPKYMSMEDLPRGSLLYNFDVARQCPFVVVTEGPTDVWRFGPEAVAVLGKPSGLQAHLLAANWRKVVVLLDNDAAADSRDLFAALKGVASMEVVEVPLPDGADPGNFKTTEELRRYVANSLASQNFSLG